MKMKSMLHQIHYTFLNLLIFCFCWYSAQAQSSPKPTTVAVHLRDLESITYNCYNVDDGVFTENLVFTNPTKQRTVVEKKFVLTKPTVITYGNILVSHKGRKEYFQNILMLPGDSIVLQKTDSLPLITYPKDGNRSLNSLLTIVNAIDLKVKVNLLSKGLNPKSNNYGVKLIQRISGIYRNNKTRIQRAQNNGTIDSVFARYLHHYNYTQKCNLITDITFNPANFKELLIDNNILDSCYDEIEQHFSQTQLVSTETPLFGLINYRAFQKHHSTTNFWDHFDLVDKTIRESDFYKKQIFHSLVLLANNKETDTTKLKLVITKVKAKGFNEMPVDSLYESLSRARSSKLSYLNDGNYSLITDNGESKEYFALLRSLQGKMILVDFWASWCIPCRQQMPYLRDVKIKLQDSSIAFVSISIDEDDKHDDWLKANKNEKLDQERYSFRLTGGKDSKLLRHYDISSIPRYILYDKNGKIASYSFSTPDQKTFFQDLLNALHKP